ncbi:MAG: putative phage integrase [Neobacillus sp.]|nr:putative phage integrase [Neobacillus sp.]
MFQQFLNEIRITRKENTYKTYMEALKTFSGYHTFEPQDILRYIESQHSQSDVTIKNRLVILGQFLRYSRSDSPKSLDIIKNFKVNRKLQPCPTQEEYQKILDNIDNPKYRLAFLMASEMGLRVSEMTGIDLEDIKGDDIIVRDTKNHTDIAKPTTPKVQEALQKYLSIRQDTCDALFTSNRGRLSIKQIQDTLKEVYRDCGCGEYHMHSFRRLFANTLNDNNVPVPVIQAAMGHKSMASTQMYLNISGKQVKNAIGIVFG